MTRSMNSKLAIALVGLSLAACSGSSEVAATQVTPAATMLGAFSVTALVSDGAVPAKTTDKSLKNPWGIVFNPTGPVWTANNGSNTSTLYQGPGNKVPLTVAIPAGKNGSANPTGIVYNGGGGFVVGSGLLSGSSAFIFSGEGGTISGWSLNADPLKAFTTYDDGAGGAVYKGLALADNANAAFLYATDFHNNKIDVFDSGFKKIAATGFQDPDLPAGYAPFGIQNIGGMLYVTYALQKGPANHDEVDGPGLGFVDLYDPAGQLVRRVAGGEPLNAPWGLALAPGDFGAASKALLVGNFGNGWINAFDPASGGFLGSLADAGGKPLVIDGLWGLVFGNGQNNQPANSLFFTAGTNGEQDGTYGRIDQAAK